MRPEGLACTTNENVFTLIWMRPTKFKVAVSRKILKVKLNVMGFLIKIK